MNIKLKVTLIIMFCFCGFLCLWTSRVEAQTLFNDAKADLVWSEYRQYGNQIIYSRFENDHWSDGVKITNNNMNNITPCIGKGPDGMIWVIWTVVKGLKSELFYSYSNGATWTSPEAIPTGFSSNTAPSVFVMPDNIPWIVWSGFDGQVDNIYFLRKTKGGWTDPLKVNLDNAVPDTLPVIGVNAAGIPWVHWSGYDGGSNYRHYSSIWTGNEWQAETQEETNDNAYLAKITLMLREVPILPDALIDTNQASIYIEGGEVQSLPLRYLQRERVVGNPIEK